MTNILYCSILPGVWRKEGRADTPAIGGWTPCVGGSCFVERKERIQRFVGQFETQIGRGTMTKLWSPVLVLLVGLLSVGNLSSCGKSKKQKRIDNYVKLVDQECACVGSDQETTMACLGPLHDALLKKIQAGKVAMDPNLNDPSKLMKKYEGSSRMMKAINRSLECRVATQGLPCKAVNLPSLAEGVEGDSLRPAGGLSVWVSKNGISILGGAETGGCQSIEPWPLPTTNQYRIEPLQEAIKGRFEQSGADERVAYIYADQEVSFELLSKVIYNLAMQEFLDMKFMGRSGDEYAVVFEPHMPRIQTGKQKDLADFGWYPSLSIGTSSIGAIVSIVDPFTEKVETKEEGGAVKETSSNRLYIQAADGSCPAIKRGPDGSIDRAQLNALFAGICGYGHASMLLGPDPNTPLKDLLVLVRAADRNPQCAKAFTLSIGDPADRADCSPGVTLEALDAEHAKLVKKREAQRARRLRNRSGFAQIGGLSRNENDIGDGFDGGAGRIGDKTPTEKGVAKVSIVKRTTDVRLGPVQQGNKEITKTIRRNMASLRWCYEKTLKRDPKRRGKVVVSLAISPTGLVRDVKVTRSTVKDSKLETCIVNRIRNIRFPASKDGKAKKVSFPFVFKPVQN